jgi:alcohol dehydrogenase class IV
MEHPLCGIKTELSHGLGLAILLAAVVKTIYPAKGAILAELLGPMVPGLTGDPGEAQKAADGIYAWLKSVGVPEKLGDIGFTKDQVPKLVQLTFDTPVLGALLACAPVDSGKEAVEKIYSESF